LNEYSPDRQAAYTNKELRLLLDVTKEDLRSARGIIQDLSEDPLQREAATEYE